MEYGVSDMVRGFSGLQIECLGGEGLESLARRTSKHPGPEVALATDPRFSWEYVQSSAQFCQKGAVARALRGPMACQDQCRTQEKGSRVRPISL